MPTVSIGAYFNNLKRVKIPKSVMLGLQKPLN